MTKQAFLDELTELLELEGELTLDSNLAEMEEYDSLAVMSLVAMIFSKFKKKIAGQDLAKVSTVNDLILLIGEENFRG